MNELIQIGPISPLRQRLIDDMAFRRFTQETQRGYLRDVGRFATWLGRSPHTASAEDIRHFQIEQQQAGVPAPTMNKIGRASCRERVCQYVSLSVGTVPLKKKENYNYN